MNIKEKSVCRCFVRKVATLIFTQVKKIDFQTWNWASDKCVDVSNYITGIFKKKTACLKGETGPEIQLFQDLMS